MTVACASNEEQAALWNGVAGTTWVEAQELLDRLYEAFERLLVETARAGSARSVLDVGCGTGATTLAIASALGAGACSVGVDISAPMIALATERARRERSAAQFVRADAQTHGFEPGTFDMIVSRFGVMFFDDAVAAFKNLLRAARPGASLRVIAWRGAEENAFMTTAERAAVSVLPTRRPGGPGPFAFADAARVRGLLEQSGWRDVDIRTLDVPCALPKAQLADYVTRLGPLGQTLQDADEPTRGRVLAKVLPAFDPYVNGDEIRFVAACWLICARAPEA